MRHRRVFRCPVSCGIFIVMQIKVKRRREPASRGFAASHSIWPRFVASLTLAYMKRKNLEV